MGSISNLENNRSVNSTGLKIDEKNNNLNSSFTQIPSSVSDSIKAPKEQRVSKSVQDIKAGYSKGNKTDNNYLQNQLQKATMSSVMSSCLRGICTPFTASIDKMIFENINFNEAAKKVIKKGFKGAYTGLTPTCLKSFISPFSYLTGLALGTNLVMYNQGISLEEAQKSVLPKLFGASLTALSITPLENIRTQMQNGGVVKYNYKRLMRGATPNLTIALCQLVFGLTMGAAINNKIKSTVTSESYSKIMSNIIGLTLGSCLANPAYNVARHMRITEKGGVMDALRKMNFFKNPMNGWRSYPESLPISIFTSLILSSSLEYGDRYFKQKNEL